MHTSNFRPHRRRPPPDAHRRRPPQPLTSHRRPPAVRSTFKDPDCIETSNKVGGEGQPFATSVHITSQAHNAPLGALVTRSPHLFIDPHNVPLGTLNCFHLPLTELLTAPLTEHTVPHEALNCPLTEHPAPHGALKCSPNRAHCTSRSSQLSRDGAPRLRLRTMSVLSLDSRLKAYRTVVLLVHLPQAAL